MKIVSFGLWGDSPIYTCGAIANAKLVRLLFPDWRSVFYLGSSVPTGISDELENLGAITIRVQEPEDYSALMWRYRAVLIPDVTAAVFRDTDSRLSVREKSLVDAWLDSGRPLHVIRDHPFHTAPILGGMWGCRGVPSLRKIGDLLPVAIAMGRDYGMDQKFLASHIYPLFESQILVHDAFFNFERDSQRRMSERENGEFIGERFDCSENPEIEARQSLLDIQGSPARLFITRLIEHRRWRRVWGIRPAKAFSLCPRK